MKSTMRALAALALLGFLGGCAQIGIPTPDFHLMEPATPAIYETSISD